MLKFQFDRHMTIKTYKIKKDKDKNKTMKLWVDFDKDKEGGGEVLHIGWQQELLKPTPHTILQMWEARYSQD